MFSTVKVFDVLMINGTSLAQKSLRRRKEVLSKDRVFRTIPGRFELADLWDGSTADDIDNRLKDIVGLKRVDYGLELCVEANHCVQILGGKDWLSKTHWALTR